MDRAIHHEARPIPGVFQSGNFVLGEMPEQRQLEVLPKPG